MIWRPIEKFVPSCSKWADGYDKKLLLTNGDEIHIGSPRYDHDDHGTPELEGWRTDGEGWFFKPTHWMPLPELP